MAIAHVQNATEVTVAASSTTGPSITITGATGTNALCPTATIGDAADTNFTISSISDGGNTFTVRSGVATDASQRIYAVGGYAVNITGGDRTVVFNLAGTSAGSNRYYTLGVMEFSGVATSSPEDTFDANDDINTGTTDCNAGPITTTDAGDLIFGAAAINSLDTTLNFGSPASWTNVYRENDAASFYGHDSGYWLPGATQTTYTAQWSHDNDAGDGCAVVVALKPAAGVAGGGGFGQVLLGGKRNHRVFS
jgi:hypothetical protein